LDNGLDRLMAPSSSDASHPGARVLAFAGCALALMPLGAHAVYKCTGPGTTPIYQDDPCPPGKELRNFDTDPPNLSIVPGRTIPASPRETAPAPARSVTESKSAKTDKRAKLRGDPAQRKHIHAGMSEAELIAHLGAPDVTSGNKQKHSVRWTWLPAEGDPDTITTVTLVNGAVASVDRKVVKK
jgi:hypothetical protein